MGEPRKHIMDNLSEKEFGDLFEKIENLVESFDIERVKRENRNLCNPLFPVVRRLERYLGHKKGAFETIPLMIRLFRYFRNSKDAYRVQEELIEMASSNYDEFLNWNSILVGLLINKYHAYY